MTFLQLSAMDLEVYLFWKKKKNSESMYDKFCGTITSFCDLIGQIITWFRILIICSQRGLM